MKQKLNSKKSDYPAFPLTLPREAVEEFQQIFFKTYNKTITSELASYKGTALMKEVLAVYRPIPKKVERKSYGK